MNNGDFQKLNSKFKIVKSDEPLNVETVTVLIYGEPGAGKTSLANTAEAPITLDFDKGAHRSEFRKDVLVIEDWHTINNNLKDLFKVFESYKTIVLDTVDTLLDYMGYWIIEREPKLARVRIQFFGRLREEFTMFIKQLKTLKKDIVMIAHVKERDEGDLRIKRPAIIGGSYDRVLQISDFVGYLFFKDNKRVIDFNPSDYWIGKNSAKIPPLEIPDFNEKPNYLARLIKKMKESINKGVESHNETVEKINKIEEMIQKAQTAKEINALITYFKNLDNKIKIQVQEKLRQRANELNLVFDNLQKKYLEEAQ